MSAVPVRAQLIASKRPTPSRVINVPLRKLDVMYPVTEANNSIPSASSGIPKSPRMEGQAMPNNPSGIPKAINAT